MVRLPLTSDPYRTFTIILGEAQYELTQRWNERASVWTLDIVDSATGDLLALAMPLVLGSDLLQSFVPQLGHLVALDTRAEPGVGVDAGPDDLGSRVQVLWFSRDEVTGA